MCGRFALGNNHQEIFEQLIRDGVLPAEDEPEWVDREDYYPRYNVAPQSRAPVIRQRPGAPNDEPEEPGMQHEGAATQDSQLRESSSTSTTNYTTLVQTMKWGVVPRNKTSDSRTLNTINARIETILEGSYLWSPLVDTQRCVVVFDGYYEWQTNGKHKIPYFIRHPDSTRKLYAAALWDKATPSSEDKSSPLYTFSIVTVPAQPDMEWLHDRMPLLFSPTSPSDMQKISTWLDPRITWASGIKQFLASYASESHREPFTIYRVPPEVGKVGAESPSFIQPIDERKDGIKASFAKQRQAPGSSESMTSSLKRPRSRSSTPMDSPAKRMKVDASGSSPTKGPKAPRSPASPRKQSPSKKSKAQATSSKPITAFFSITSPGKGSRDE